MAPIVKWPLEDREHGRTRLHFDAQAGWSGSKFALIGTADLVEAALSVPVAVGDSFDARIPHCRCVGFHPEWWRGPNGTGGTDLGHSVVEVIYATASNGRLPPPVVGMKFTELSGADESVQVYFDVNQPPGTSPLNGPINNFDGAPRLVGTVQAKVTVYYGLGVVFDFGRLIDLQRNKYVSNGPLTLPAVLGTGTALSFGAGQVRFERFEGPVLRENSVVEMSYTLALAPDHKFRWRLENELGFGVADQEADLYKAGNLGGIW